MKVIETVKDFLKLTEDDTSISIFMREDEYDKFEFPEWINDIEIRKYKYELDNLTNKIKKLKLHEYEYNLDNLPNSLIELELMGYDNKLDNWPVLQKTDGKFLKNFRPLSLKKLHINNSEFIHSLDYLNEGLEELKIETITPYKNSLNNLPSTLVRFELFCFFDYNYTFSNLPNSLEEIVLSCNFHLDNIPKNLKKIKFDDQVPDYKDIVEKINKISPDIIIEIQNAVQDFNNKINEVINIINEIK